MSFRKAIIVEKYKQKKVDPLIVSVEKAKLEYFVMSENTICIETSKVDIFDKWIVQYETSKNYNVIYDDPITDNVVPRFKHYFCHSKNSKISEEELEKHHLHQEYCTQNSEFSETTVMEIESIEFNPMQKSGTSPKEQKMNANATNNTNIKKIKKNVVPTINVASYLPTAIKTIYGFSTPTVPVSIGIIALSGNIDADMIKSYWQNDCKIPLANIPKIVIVNADRTKLTGYEIENTLDVEIAGAIAASPNTKIVVYTASNTMTGFYSAFASAINDTINKPTVISCSWGLPEQMMTLGTLSGKLLVNAFNDLFAVAVSKGINICCATGDNGASDGLFDGKPHVDFPASSPNVVACGGTSLNSNGTNYSNKTVEIVWSWNLYENWGTGGGSSVLFTRPSYQKQTNIPSNTMRTIPDISAIGDPDTGIIIRYGDMGTRAVLTVVGGTSCAAPIIAGYIGSLGTLGFVNNYVYKMTGAFNKITYGTNGLYSANDDGSYSLCTGLGTINGSVLTPLLVSQLTANARYLKKR
jgi:subtilase family serine protease